MEIKWQIIKTIPSQQQMAIYKALWQEKQPIPVQLKLIYEPHGKQA